MGHRFSQLYSAGIRSLSGAAAHGLAINPAYGGLIPLSCRGGRNTKNTDSTIIAPAAIMEIACQRIMPSMRPLRAQFLSLSQIKSGYIDDAVRPGLVGR